MFCVFREASTLFLTKSLHASNTAAISSHLSQASTSLCYGKKEKKKEVKNPSSKHKLSPPL